MTASTNSSAEANFFLCREVASFYHAETWIPSDACEKVKSAVIGLFTGLCVFAVMTTAFYFLQRHCSWFKISQDVTKIMNLFKNVHPVLNHIWKAIWRGYGVLGAPILEEILFRGVCNHHVLDCQGNKDSIFKRIFRILFISLIFGLCHVSPFQNWATNVTLLAGAFLIGIVLHTIREMRKDLVAPAFTHLFYNLSAMI